MNSTVLVEFTRLSLKYNITVIDSANLIKRKVWNCFEKSLNI